MPGFASLAAHFEPERPETAAGQLSAVLRGPRTGQPLTTAAVDQMLRDARERGARTR